MPELLWKAYIDLEVEEGERARARALYERLLERSGHVKVWIAYALFEGANIGGEDDEDEGEVEVEVAEENRGDPVRARAIFERGYKDLKGREWTDVFALFPLPFHSLVLICCFPAGCSPRGMEGV